MRTYLKILSSVIIGGALMVPALAQAQDLTVRLEPGVAVPLGKPQTQHFDVGADGMVKLDIPTTAWLDVVPGVGVLAVPQSSDFSKTGTAWMVGGGLRLKRPHDNKGSGLTAVSPWLDGDLQYVRTGELDRFGWAVGAGAAVPTSDSRWLWVGPFVRYQSVFDASKAGFDTTDAKVLVAGLSFEFGAPRKKAAAVLPPPPVVVVPPPPVVVAPPPPAMEDRAQNLHAVVQFKVDSWELDAQAVSVLDDLVLKIKAGRLYSDITVQGNASSDGPLAHNKVLAQNRAKSVIDYLVAHGIDAGKMHAQNMGITNPTQSNKTLKGRQANRRSEVFVNVTISVKVGS